MTSYLERLAQLDGRVAVVAGGAGGLGYAATSAFCNAGMNVAVFDQDTDAVASLRDESARRGWRLLRASVVDARDISAVEAFFADLDQISSRLDVLMNAVGGSVKFLPFTETDASLWEEQISLNFRQALRITQLAIERMQRLPQGGSIINVTTVEAYRGTPPIAVYSAAKAALANLTKTLGVALAPQNIRVNSIAADVFPTPRVRPHLLGSDSEAILEQRFRVSIPMGRTGTYEDFAGCALFLASRMSSYVTGSEIFLDGGTHAASGWFNWGHQTGFTNLLPSDVAAKLGR